jgi:transposase
LNRDSQGTGKVESWRVIRFLGCAMTKPYSADLRVRVVEAVDEGATRQEAAERFGVSVSSAVRWHQAWRYEGTIEAKPYGGSRSPLEDHAEEIVTVIEEQPDLTLDEIVAVLRKRKIPGSRTALFRFLERHAVTSKKSPSRCRTGADGRGSRPPAMDTRAGLA